MNPSIQTLFFSFLLNGAFDIHVKKREGREAAISFINEVLIPTACYSSWAGFLSTADKGG